MANPQKENGYTAIANEILDVLTKTPLQSSERRVLDVVFRKTYGFNKKEDSISISQITEATGLSKRTVIYATQNLEAKIMVAVAREDMNTNRYRFQKDYDKWVVQRNSPQYEQLLAKMRKNYKKKGSAKKPNDRDGVREGVVQRKPSPSAKKTVKLVQRRDKNGRFFAHTKDKSNKDITKDSRSATAPTPKQKAETFFRGVEALIEGKPVEWLSALLAEMVAKNPKVVKAVFWREIKDFCFYWTERNSTGMKEKWQMQKTFEVDRRLTTWFNRAGFNGFSSGGMIKAKGKEIIGL